MANQPISPQALAMALDPSILAFMRPGDLQGGLPQMQLGPNAGPRFPGAPGSPGPVLPPGPNDVPRQPITNAPPPNPFGNGSRTTSGILGGSGVPTGPGTNDVMGLLAAHGLNINQTDMNAPDAVGPQLRQALGLPPLQPAGGTPAPQMQRPPYPYTMANPRFPY